MTERDKSPVPVPLYDSLGEKYDSMVDWPGRVARESPFFEARFREADAHSVIDIGCGTGWHARRFAELGLRTVGADPSGELLSVARRRHGELPNLTLVQAGLGALKGALGRENMAAGFGAALCIGNTLPHIEKPAVVPALAEAFDLLAPGGVFIIQQLNYDRILGQRVRFLGASPGVIPANGGDDTPERLFFRFYDYPESSASEGQSGLKLEFNFVTFERGRGEGGWSYTVDSTPLYPLVSTEVESALREAGFSEISAMGSYGGEPFAKDSSNDLVIVARRG